MTALTKERDTLRREGDFGATALAAGAKVYGGGLICVDTTTGFATKGITSTTLRVLGVAEETVDNTGGTAGAIHAKWRRDGWFQFANSASGDLITTADIGADCYLVDDQTVAKTNGTNTRSVAGKVRQVETSGAVWISFN